MDVCALVGSACYHIHVGVDGTITACSSFSFSSLALGPFPYPPLFVLLFFSARCFPFLVPYHTHVLLSVSPITSLMLPTHPLSTLLYLSPEKA